MDQREIWNLIAPKWEQFRKNPHKDVVEFLRNEEGLVLDVGCGAGRNMLKGKKYVAFDFAEKQLFQAKNRAEAENIDAAFAVASSDAIPFRDNLFDAAVAANVIPTMQAGRIECLKEMIRVMKPGAKAVITVWNKNQPRFLFKKKEEYVPWRTGNRTLMRYYYLFTKAELKKLLEKAGFSVLKIRGSKHKVFGIFSSDIVAVIQKP